MGLLDNLGFSQGANFGGEGGGLLDLISRTLAQNSQYQPSAGFPAQAEPRQFDNASFDPQTFAPNQAQSIAVGGYQMPRLSGADQYQSQQAMLPPNAQPAQGQLPQGQSMPPPQMQAPQQPAQQPEQALPPAFGGGGSFLGRLGNPDGLIARLTGNDTRSQGQQNLKAQYESLRQTLIANGETPQAASSKAMVAAMNPEAAKTIIPELFTSKQKYGVISKDPLEGEKYGFIDERNQTVNGKPIDAGSQPSTGGGSLAGLQAARAAGVTGEALYQHLPPQFAPTVRAMIEGRQPLPSTAAMRSPATLALIDAAHAVDPTFDATSWASRQAGAKDFTSGKSAEMVRAANQTMSHVGSLLTAMDNLKNTSYPIANAIGNTVRENLGAGEQGAFRTNAHAVAEEMSKVFKGANLSDAEIRHWEQNLTENMSPAQQKAQIAKLSELLHGSLSALDEKRVAAIGPMAAAKAGPILKEEAQRVLERIDSWVKGNAPEAAKVAGGVQEGATATNPQTGAKITFRGGKWQ